MILIFKQDMIGDISLISLKHVMKINILSNFDSICIYKHRSILILKIFAKIFSSFVFQNLK